MTMATNPPSETCPALWNPNAAACWSLLFTPAFGAYLHARNADAMGRTQEAKANRICFYASLGFLAFVLFSIFIPQIPESVCRAIGMGLLIGWYVSTGKVQARYVAETWQKSYPRKPWTKPLLVAVNCLIGYVVLIFVVAVVADVFFGIQ